MALNINRNVDDLFYRYKMPKLQAKVEGKGNGIKTVIANMAEIAKALNRPPTYPTKYFGCELGAQTQFDLKNERYIVNGEHDATKLQDLLDGFIKKFVLCPGCSNPETVLTVKGQKINQSCKACGLAGVIDGRHKLTTFIVKNPPDPESTDKENAPAVAGKKGKVRKSKEQRQAAGENGTAAAEEEKEGEDGKDNSDEADYDDWGDELHGDDIACTDELPNHIAALTMNDDLEKTVDERLDMFYNYLLEQKKKASKFDPKEVVNEAERLDVKDKSALLLCRVLFDADPEKIVTNIEPNKALLQRFTVKNKRAQRYLLGGLEQLVVVHKAELLQKLPNILNAFYFGDIIEEDVLLEWGEKPSKRYVNKEESKEIRTKAEPFLKWLREAEVESDEEDEVEVTFEEKGRGAAAAPVPVPAHKQNGVTEMIEEKDDFDIDEI